MKRSLYNSATVVSTLVPATYAATTNGTSVDRAAGLANFRTAMLIVSTGTVTDGTHVIKLQESANGSAWTDVAAGDLQGSAISVGSSSDNTVYHLGYTGSARYLRAVTTVTGTPATGGVYSAVIALSGARRTPVPRS